VDRKEIIAKLTRAHDEVDSVLQSLLNGDQTRISWTRLLAHNVNNHLTSVFYIIERFVQSGLATDEVTTYIDGLKGIAERIQETMQRMMTVAQFDNLVKLTPVKFGNVAGEAVQRQEGYARLKSIDLEARFDAPAGVMVEADRVALMEAMLNLIGNALKYSPRGSAVMVSTGLSDGSVSFSVRDHGPGISPEEQKRLFKVGSVLSTKPTMGEPQTGIGLAMTAELVKSMGGRVWCDSLVGKGSTFSLCIPVSPDSKERPC
jgi:signal transduction histidine kinase